MMDYQKDSARRTAGELIETGFFDELGDCVSWICNTSVDDGKHSVKTCDNILHLEAALAYENRNGPRKSLVASITSRIKKLRRRSCPD